MAFNKYCQAVGCDEKVHYEFELKQHIGPYGRERKSGMYCTVHALEQLNHLIKFVESQRDEHLQELANKI